MTNIPSKQEIKQVLEYEYPRAKRDDKQRGTNCEWFHLNYLKKWKEWKTDNIRLYVKKWFIKWVSIEKLEWEIGLIKEELWNIVPNQAFVPFKDDIFVVCSPVNIKCDVLEKWNYHYMINIAVENPKLLRQLKFFVQKFEKIIWTWNILDLHWVENLVISDINKLYYLDSFLIFHDNETVKNNSLKNLDFLKKIIFEAEKKIENQYTW